MFASRFMRHLAVKHGEGVAPDEDGQYPCSVCGKSLSSWNSHVAHQRSYHAEHQCPHCPV